MRRLLSEKFQNGRLREGYYRSSPSDGPMGVFIVQGPCGTELIIMSSGVDQEDGWEHVSVSTKRRPPNWQEMSFVKDAFWHDDEVVVQFHPAKKDYINCHPNCLHLWRHKDGHKTPPTILIGPQF